MTFSGHPSSSHFLPLLIPKPSAKIQHLVCQKPGSVRANALLDVCYLLLGIRFSPPVPPALCSVNAHISPGDQVKSPHGEPESNFQILNSDALQKFPD